MAMKPDLVVALAICALSVPSTSTAQQTETLATLEKRVERLQGHLESIESVRAIKRVQLAYGHYVEFSVCGMTLPTCSPTTPSPTISRARVEERQSVVFF